MPRAPRAVIGGIVYHVLNRANARLPLFESDADYELFVAGQKRFLTPLTPIPRR